MFISPPMSHSVIRTVIDMKFLSVVSDLCVQGVNSDSYAQLVNITNSFTLITEVFPGTREMKRKEKPLKKLCQNPVEHAR